MIRVALPTYVVSILPLQEKLPSKGLRHLLWMLCRMVSRTLVLVTHSDTDPAYASNLAFLVRHGMTPHQANSVQNYYVIVQRDKVNFCSGADSGPCVLCSCWCQIAASDYSQSLCSKGIFVQIRRLIVTRGACRGNCHSCPKMRDTSFMQMRALIGAHLDGH